METPGLKQKTRSEEAESTQMFLVLLLYLKFQGEISCKLKIRDWVFFFTQHLTLTTCKMHNALFLITDMSSCLGLT